MDKNILLRREFGDGNYMAALAGVHAEIQYSMDFQITPDTQFVEHLFDFKRRGILPSYARLALANGENDAFTACHMASQCGRRVITGSCSQGFGFSYESIKSLAGSRCPVVIINASRTISAPVNIHYGTDDAYIFENCGITIVFARTPQEVYDWTLLMFKVAEDLRVQLPVIVSYAGFDVSHTVTGNTVLSEEGLKLYRSWLGKYVRPNSLLNPGHPVSLGGLALPPFHMDINYALMKAGENVISVTKEAIKYFSETFRKVPDIINGYKTEDAKYLVVSMGSDFGTMKEAVDMARERGVKVGAVSYAMFRPFPVEDTMNMKAFGRAKSIAVFERCPAYGRRMGIFASDICTSLSGLRRKPYVMSCLAGLGGKMFPAEFIDNAIDRLTRPDEWKNNPRPFWFGVNGGE
jgi:pyruvate ferredoxin oxidoreductase alpha subunit